MIDPDQKDWSQPELPLARIKKIMKSEDEVKLELGGQRFMISAEAPVMFAKACEIFALELTMLAWNHTEENKRRTLQRNDIVMAVSKNDTYDFLIDIVPRDNVKPSKKDDVGSAMPVMDPSQYFIMQQQQAAAAQQMMAQGQMEQQQQMMMAQGQIDPQQQMMMAQQGMDQQQMMQLQQQQQLAAAATNPQAMQYQMMWQQQLMQQQYYQQHQMGMEGEEDEEQESPESAV